MGGISKEIEEATNRVIKSAPIRLQVGHNGMGYRHIVERHFPNIQGKDFPNPISYIKHILKNFNQIYQAVDKEGNPSSNRIILHCKGDQSKGYMPIELEVAKSDNEKFYTIITAYPKDKPKKAEKLLFDDSAHSSSVAATDSLMKVGNNNAALPPSAPNAKSNFSNKNIAQGEQDSNIKYSIGNSDNEHSWLKGLAKKLGKALHLNGDKIITEEDRRKAHLQEQEKAMADYLKDPSKDNKYRLNKLGVTKGQLQAYMNGEEYLTGIGLRQNTIASPSRIADEVAVFRAFFRMGDRAMDKLVKLRDSFSRKYDSAMDLVKSKEEREQLFEILWDGDEEQKVFTKEELLQDGVSENVADAYIAIRRQMNRAYTLVDEAKRRPQNYAKYLSDKQYEKLRDNKFVKQDTLKIHDKQDEDGKHLVTWTEYANYERDYIIDGSARGRFLMDDAIQILDEQQLEDGTYKVTVREGIPALTNRKGYIPHFFHEYHVTVKNADGKQIGDIIGTGRTQREAIKIAEDWQKNHTLKDGENIYITPRTFKASEFGMSEKNTPIMGDKDFEVMLSRIAKNTDTTLAEAKEIVNGAVKTKNRHRFLGQLLKRKGYKGYEKDMDWVLRHHFNTVARYVALETEFKPKAISLFERVFGDFYKDHSKNLLAQYTKNYINDVNGNPAWIDDVVNQALKQSSFWRKHFLPNIGEQGFQRIGNNIAGRIAYLKLGMGNISSALLNFTQLTNAAGYVGW